MVVLNLQQYADLTQDIELKLDEADIASKENLLRYKHRNVFSRLKDRVKNNE